MLRWQKKTLSRKGSRVLLSKNPKRPLLGLQMPHLWDRFKNSIIQEHGDILNKSKFHGELFRHLYDGFHLYMRDAARCPEQGGPERGCREEQSPSTTRLWEPGLRESHSLHLSLRTHCKTVWLQLVILILCYDQGSDPSTRFYRWETEAEVSDLLKVPKKICNDAETWVQIYFLTSKLSGSPWDHSSYHPHKRGHTSKHLFLLCGHLTVMHCSPKNASQPWNDQKASYKLPHILVLASIYSAEKLYLKVFCVFLGKKCTWRRQLNCQKDQEQKLLHLH